MPERQSHYHHYMHSPTSFALVSSIADILAYSPYSQPAAARHHQGTATAHPAAVVQTPSQAVVKSYARETLVTF
jgi:hypothetical protein